VIRTGLRKHSLARIFPILNQMRGGTLNLKTYLPPASLPVGDDTAAGWRGASAISPPATAYPLSWPQIATPVINIAERAALADVLTCIREHSPSTARGTA